MNMAVNGSPLNSIPLLEKLKDRILTAFNAAAQRDKATRNMWCGDAKEMYYSIVLADQLLSRGRDFESAQARLHVACSRFEQVRSELQALGEPGQRLEEELITVFSACRDQLAARIPAAALVATPARVIRQSANHYVLPCSVCGKRAVAVHPAGSEEKILQGIICAGIVRSVGIDPQHQGKIFTWLEKGELASLHHFLGIEQDIDGGLDAYCPQCDQIYCRTHYNVTERFDEGFYDCAYGTCPQGHRREIDD